MSSIKVSKNLSFTDYIDDSIKNSALFEIISKFAKSIWNLLKNSFFVSIIVRFSLFLTKIISKTFIFKFFTNEVNMEEKFSNSFLGRIANKCSSLKEFSKKAKRQIAFLFENSYIVMFFEKLFKGFPSYHMRSLGIFLSVFGFTSSLIRAVKYYIDYRIPGANFELGSAFWKPYVGIFSIELMFTLFIALVGLLLSTSKKSIGECTCNSKILNFLLFSVLPLDQNNVLLKKSRKTYTAIFAIIGAALGSISGFFNPILIILAIMVLEILYIIMTKPETGVVLLFFCLPFFPTKVLAGLIILTFFSFIIKWIRGKRVVRFEFFDILIFVFAIVLIFGGLFSVGGLKSLPPMAMYVCFLLSYFLVKNLLLSKELVKRCTLLILTSASLVSLYGIFQYFFGTVNSTWTDTDMFSSIKTRVISTFENPNVLAEYLILIIPILFAAILIAKNTRIRFPYLIMLALSGGCLIFTWSRGAWLGFLFSSIFFFLIFDKRTMVAISAGILAIPALPFILPDSILQRFTSIGNMSDSSTSYRFFIWLGTFGLLKDYSIGGIGIGEGAFRTVYPKYALSAIERAPHSHNLFMQICVEMGIFALIFYVIILLIFVQKCISFAVKNRKTDKVTSLLVIGCLSGVAAITIQGFTDYTWYNYRVYLMFWLIFSLAISAIINSKRDYVPDESHPDMKKQSNINY